VIWRIKSRSGSGSVYGKNRMNNYTEKTPWQVSGTFPSTHTEKTDKERVREVRK
jgi:hypothetical protein